MKKKLAVVPAERVAARIFVIRGQSVMFDADLAGIYGVETRVLLQAVRRNAERFPREFMFQLSKAEFENWRSQIVMSNPGAKMGLRRQPHVFTEHGVVMLSSVLRSKGAVEISIGVVLAFVKLRRVLASNEETGA